MNLPTDRPPTLADVARLAHVSVTTVSDALRGTSYIHEDTERRVREAAQSLGYRPGGGASRVRGGTNPPVVLVTDVYSEAPDAPSALMLTKMTEQLSRERLPIEMHSCHDMHAIKGSPMSALLGISADPETAKLFEPQFGLPAWVVGVNEGATVPTISHDFESLARDAVTLMMDGLSGVAPGTQFGLITNSGTAPPAVRWAERQLVDEVKRRGGDLCFHSGDTTPHGQARTTLEWAQLGVAGVFYWGVSPDLGVAYLLRDAGRSGAPVPRPVFVSPESPEGELGRRLDHISFDLTAGAHQIATHLIDVLAHGGQAHSICLPHTVVPADEDPAHRSHSGSWTSVV